VDLDAKAVELDLVLPIVTGRHRLGVLRMAGLDELEEHTLLADEPRAVRHQASRLQCSLRCEPTFDRTTELFVRFRVYYVEVPAPTM
jgi:hypothetical protein